MQYEDGENYIAGQIIIIITTIMVEDENRAITMRGDGGRGIHRKARGRSLFFVRVRAPRGKKLLARPFAVISTGVHSVV